MMLADLDARCQAMTDFSSILLIEAAAGTGKTALMAGRVAMMLASGYRAEDIAAITFTELAASQLAGRIRHTIDTLIAGEVPAFLQPVIPRGLSAPQREALRAASLRLDDLTATTIHGFCQAIIRSHGVQAGLDPGARVVDATAADNLFMAELAAWLSRRLAEDAVVEDPIVVLAEEIPLQVVELVRELAMLRRKHPEARPVPPRASGRPDIDLIQAVDAFTRWQAGSGQRDWLEAIEWELRRLTTPYADCLSRTGSFASMWRLCAPGSSSLFVGKGLELATFDDMAQACGAYPEEVGSDEGRMLYDAIATAWNGLIGHLASTLVCALSHALDEVLEGYQARKRAAAVMDFEDLLLHVRSLVRGNEEVGQAIGSRFRHILVDEFQDTDRIQSEILFSIAGTTDRPARWEAASLRPGALFLVGDPKQAIYRFRGADIEAYEVCRNAVAALDGGVVLEVTANFRSQAAILRHVNACFQPVFAKASQPRYVALSPTLFEPSHQLPCVARLTVEVPTSGRVYADALREAEAEKVAEVCDALIGNLSILRPDKVLTPLQAGDIALLSPGHTELWRYERALERRGLSVSSQAGQSLMRRQETQDILALLRVLIDSADTLAFGALMRGPLVGLSEQELLDITAALPATESGPAFFNARTDPEQVQHVVAREVLQEVQRLRRRISRVSPSVILAEAIERLNIRVIVAARHRSRNARALANLDALIERARSCAVSGLRTFVHDLQSDWERRTRAAEGRVDTAEDAIEIVTIHSAKGLEWPVVITINSTTEFYRPDQFIHRHSDNTLHWMLGGVAPPELAAAREAESLEEVKQRERIWYVACTRARDLLILPHIPQAKKDSWFSSVDLRQQALDELDLSLMTPRDFRSASDRPNEQTTDVFAAEQRLVESAAPTFVWRQPSKHDGDRVADPLDSVVIQEGQVERLTVIGGGARRGVVLHKRIEELLTGELPEDLKAIASRARTFVDQLTSETQSEPGPDPNEMATAVLRGLALPQVAALRPYLVPEVPLWGSDQANLVAGRADALAIRGETIEAVVDWKSDVNPTSEVRSAHLQQLRDYLSATGARSGGVVYLTSGEIVWFQSEDALKY